MAPRVPAFLRVPVCVSLSLALSVWCVCVCMCLPVRACPRVRVPTSQEALLTSERLYENAFKLAAKRESLKAVVPSECTFAPVVTHKARTHGAVGQDRFESLYRNAAATRQKLEVDREKVPPRARV